MTNALFCDVRQREVVIFTDVSRQPIVLKVEPIGCPETSVINYHRSLRNDPEEHSPHLLRSGSLNSHKFGFNSLTPNDPYMSRTAPLTSKRCILYICSTNIGTESFKHALYSPFFSLQNAVCFIMLTCLVPVLFTFYMQGVLKLKKIIPAPKG